MNCRTDSRNHRSVLSGIVPPARAGVLLLLLRFGIDRAVSSAVFVTTFTDVFRFLIFRGCWWIPGC